MLTQECRAQDLTTGHRVFLLILVSIGSSIIYMPAFLQYVFEDALGKALIASGGATPDNVTTTLGTLLSAYATTALICYLPSGIVADVVRVRTLSWVGFGLTALLTFWYAMFPSLLTIRFLFVAMGVSTILIWWGIRYKLVRLISEESAYSRNIGISYAFYGLAGVLLGFFNSWLLGRLASQGDLIPMRVLLIILGCIIMLLAVLSFFFIPKFEGEFESSEGGFSIKQLGTVLSNPVVWLAAATLFFVYFFYTGVNQTTGYMKEVMVLPIVVVTMVASIRTYGVSLLSAPFFGGVAQMVGSPSRVIAGGSIAASCVFVCFAVLPSSANAVLAASLVIVLAFLANGVFGIVSSQLTEGKIPPVVFGTASGLLSVIGFLPDTFSYTWFGSIRDAAGDAKETAFHQIFLILAGSALLAALCAIALVLLVRARSKKQADDEN